MFLDSYGKWASARKLINKWTTPFMRQVRSRIKSQLQVQSKNQRVSIFISQVSFTHLQGGGEERRLSSSDWMVKDRGMKVSLTSHESRNRGPAPECLASEPFPRTVGATKMRRVKAASVWWRVLFSRAIFSATLPDGMETRCVGSRASSILRHLN